ncbi:MAG: hypothetical protein OEY45_11830 [Gammaproteobacteria bacterium]|nr:hypothetical protein [Gammaproteobacteria bacterium]MDH5515838.1 hypothetical protein [Gammaproteobacteria bacterium]
MKIPAKMRIALLLVVSSGPVMAQVEISTTAEIEIVEVQADGREVVRLERPGRVIPGTEVIYTITAKNTGAQPADSVVVTNPVPLQTRYVDGSASGANTDITFSVDGGQSWGVAQSLTVIDANGEERAATADDYTHVRWTLQSGLAPDQQVPVWYRAQVK